MCATLLLRKLERTKKRKEIELLPVEERKLDTRGAGYQQGHSLAVMTSSQLSSLVLASPLKRINRYNLLRSTTEQTGPSKYKQISLKKHSLTAELTVIILAK